MANEDLEPQDRNRRPESPNSGGGPQFAFDFYPNQDGVWAQQAEYKALAGQAPVLWGSAQ